MDLQTYINLDATRMKEMMDKQEITSKKLVTLSFEQLKKVNDKLNIVTNTREEAANKETEQSEASVAPFAGIPFLLKDISQSVQDEPLTSGARLMKSFVASEDSNLVNKLREAGFIFTGHTNTPEFALKNITEPELHGPTRNPWNINYSPGGSSGGAAAAVASGVVPVAGASDGGGSIRIPASFTSLFGLKPTRGRTPVGPGVGRQWQGASIDFVLSRTVRDSASMLNVLQTVQPEAAFQTPLFPGNYVEAMKEPFQKKLRIAFTTESPVGTPVSTEAKLATEKMVTWLEEAGHIVEERDNGVDGIQLMKNYFLMNSGEMSTVVSQMEQTMGRDLTAQDMEIESWILNVAGKSVSAAEFSASLSSWDVAAAQMAALHETYDFYITPATAFPAPEIGELTWSKAKQKQLIEQINEIDVSERQALVYDMFLPSLTYTPFTQLANLTGQPAMSVPIHLTKTGLPIGVQVMASKGEEHRLLQLAFQLEQSDLWVGMNGNPLFNK